jgi:hypothetical protein
VLLLLGIVLDESSVSRGEGTHVDETPTLSGFVIETNSPLFRVSDLDGEETLLLTDNTYVPGVDDISGKVALIGEPRKDYRMKAEMKFLGHHLSMEGAGWFGFAIRARNLENFELVWFMPSAEESATVAYLPVAHGIVPWWTEAYAKQQKGGPKLPSNDWFQAQVDVIGDEITVFVDGEPVLKKKLSYYLSEGRPGFYVGTATDVAIRRVVIEDILETTD